RRQEPIGVYVETKHPTYFDRIGISLNELLIADLSEHGFDDARVVIQSFEPGNLQELRPQTAAFLVQLLSPTGAPADFRADGDERTYADLTTPAGLEFIAGYADGIGPHKTMV